MYVIKNKRHSDSSGRTLYWAKGRGWGGLKGADTHRTLSEVPSIPADGTVVVHPGAEALAAELFEACRMLLEAESETDRKQYKALLDQAIILARRAVYRATEDIDQ